MVFRPHRLEQLCVQTQSFSSRTFNLAPLFPGATPSGGVSSRASMTWLVRGNTCRTMMNGSVVPGRGEVTATFRGACQQDERSIQEVKEAPVCHRRSTLLMCVVAKRKAATLAASLAFVTVVSQLLWPYWFALLD